VLFLTFLILLLVGSLLINVVLVLVVGASSVGSGLHEDTLVEGDAGEKVAVLSIDGIILDRTAQRFIHQLSRLEKDSNVKAIVLSVDTPGGSVTASDVIYHAITDYKARHTSVPVVVTMGGLATSGGYYVSCAADYIIAQPTTMTGNIGVVMPRYDLSKLADKWGIEDNSLHSTGADFKTAGSMFRPETPAEHEYILSIIDSAFAQFKKVISDGRGSKLAKPIDTISNGKVYVTDEALALGLVDAKGYAEDAYNYAATKAGLTRKTVVRVQDSPRLMEQLLSSRSSLGGASAGSGGVTVNGVNVNLGPETIEAFSRPRLMYLWGQ
jgi:protease-4